MSQAKNSWANLDKFPSNERLRLTRYLTQPGDRSPISTTDALEILRTDVRKKELGPFQARNCAFYCEGVSALMAVAIWSYMREIDF